MLDMPPRAALEAAQALLQELGAINSKGEATNHARKLARLPLHPRLAHMLLEGAALGAGLKAAQLAALLSEPALGGTAIDVNIRLARFMENQSQRGKAARAQAKQWARLAGADVHHEERTPADISAGALLSIAFPDRIGKARDAAGSTGFVLANGRGALLESAESLSLEPFLVAADVVGTAERMRVLLAAPLSLEEIYDFHGTRIKTREVVRLEGKSGRVEALLTQSLGALVLKQTILANPSAEATKAALLTAIRAEGAASLAWSEELRHWQSRVLYLFEKFGDPWPDVSDDALAQGLEQWLGPYLPGVQKRADIDEALLAQALAGHLTPQLAKELDRLAPARFTTPAQTSHLIDYQAAGGPSVALRVQELFGLGHHPHIGDVPLTLILLSPAQRPIQTTRDLPNFWRGSWSSVKSEMRGRYPRHVWPDDPTQAQATTRTKPRN
jgi:ATP-dependent helicase HrpB